MGAILNSHMSESVDQENRKTPVITYDVWSDPRSPSDGIDRTPIQIGAAESLQHIADVQSNNLNTPQYRKFLKEVDTFEPIDGVVTEDELSVNGDVKHAETNGKKSKNPINRLRSSFRKFSQSTPIRRASCRDSPKDVMREKQQHRVHVIRSSLCYDSDHPKLCEDTDRHCVAEPSHKKID